MTPRRASRTLAVLLTLAAVLTAGAPSIIRVKPGDSLWEIAHRHGTTIAVLRRLNDLPGNGTIYVGELLKVPSASARTRTVERSYTVRSGDNLSLIAQRLGVSVSTLRTRNKLPRNGLVTVGRRLAYPVALGARGTSTVTTNAGVRIPASVQRSTAQHRAYLASHRQPSKAAVRKLVYKTARKHHVDPSLALAVAFHESGFQQRVVSPVDAIGVMQVLPSTGRVLGKQYGRRLDLLKAQDNITAGVLLLQQLVRSTGSADRALAGYYQGLGSVAARGLLPQTHAYIKNVSALRARFRNG
ncbi:MAG: LysM peptidoglycan-binding domain-containing protein [Actinobacteria bacterium]|nr:LysM peptidoglycan-binding domain-containing protein [Actinomycetota bacterium]